MVKFKPKLARPPKVAAMRRELMRGMADFADDMERALKQPTLTWSKPVTFTRRVDAGATWFRVVVETDDDRYRWTSEGTKPHTIRARIIGGVTRSTQARRGVLAFAKFSKAKTAPGQLVAGPGYAGGGMAYAQAVKHPGTKARRFPKAAAKVLKPVFRFRATAAAHRAADASGHAIK